jgi:hypothetical protein
MMDEPLLGFVVNLGAVGAMDEVRMAGNVPTSVTILTSARKKAQVIDLLPVWWWLASRSSGTVRWG